MNHTYLLVWNPTRQSYVPTAETARSRGKRASGKALLPAAVVLSSALLGLPAFAQAPPALAANTLPTGGNVVAGQASIGQHGSQMTIIQGSDKAILNWNSFNIGQDARVQFQQPGSSAVALNRVLAGDASHIQGQLRANGQVWLVNPNGVVFGAGSRVDVGGLIASTLSITDKDFLDGKAIFTRQGATGGITNQGQITATGDGQQDGLIALLAPTVRNDGVLTAQLGKVALAAGDQITLNAGAGGLLQVQVQAATIRTLVENRQLIVADGGQVVMTGKAADALSGSVVANTGTVQARTLASRDGRILLLADGEHGSAQVGGLLDASAPQGQGGSIQVTGQQVALADATLDASGATGGGSIQVGGGWQGGGTLARAQTTRVDAGSRLRADATRQGDGGTVVIWSDDQTRYAGHLSAQGGSMGGNGGQAEVSGKAVLDFTGTANLSAAQGQFGDLLLDPYNLTIVSGSGGTPVAAADNSTLGVDTLTNLLVGANVTVATGSGGSQAGDITVDAPVAWTANTVLTLQAAGDIAVKRDITASGASAGLELSHGAGKDYQLIDGASITLGGAAATLKIGATGALNTYTLLHDVNALQGIPNASNGRFALARDIDASPLSGGEGFAPIVNFGGTFTGLGHVVNGLTINRPSGDDIGLFGVIGSGSAIRNIGLLSVNVTGRSVVGALVGANRGGSTINRAYASGEVRGGTAIGGLVGYNEGNISQAYASVNVTASSSDGGGLVGVININGSLTHSYATGAVSGSDHIGGLVGFHILGTIDHAYATGAVSGTGGVGGLVGSRLSGGTTLTNAFYATTNAGGSSINNAGGTTGSWDGNRNGTGKTYADLTSPTTFSGWNTAIWTLPRGSSAAGYEAGLPSLAGVTRAADVVRGTLFQDGMGTAASPYGITDWQQLANINQRLGDNFNLSNNLDSSSTGYTLLASATANGGLGWTPLGNDITYFTGTFDGQDHTISGLTINRPSGDHIGLFGGIHPGSAIRNIGLLGVSVTGRSHVGALVGASQPGSTITRAYASGNVRGASIVGGLVGNSDGNISQAYASANVTASGGDGGGLAGRNGGSLTHSYATGAVSSGYNVGGVVGNHFAGTIDNAYATGAVSGTSAVGGLVGYRFPAGTTLTNAFYATTNAGGSSINNAGGTTGSWTGNRNGTGKTYADLTSPTTFSGWNTAIWTLPRGSSAAGYEVGLPSLAGVTRAADVVRGTLFQDGMGTTASPYGITDWQQLANINQRLGDNFNLSNNLDSSSTGYTLLASATANGGQGWTPLGSNSTFFTGTFNGQDHTISGLTINRPIVEYIGLFGAIGSSSVIRNIGLLGVNVTGGNIVGGLLGASQVGGTVTRAYASGNVRGESVVGGLVGASDGNISHAYASVDVAASGSDGGGLAGTSDGSLTHSYATGTVSGGIDMGGLVGQQYPNSTIDYAYATGAVSGTDTVGGLVGSRLNGATLTNAFYATASAGGSSINNAGAATGIWTGNGDGTGKTYVELTSPTTFSGWDTAIWTLPRGSSAAGYEVGLPSLAGVTRAADVVRGTLFQDGMGTAASPYGITDWQQLANINQRLGDNFNLSNNLDSSSGGYTLLASATANGGQGWTPLGNHITFFTGTFNGQDRTISGLTINRPSGLYLGLFGIIGTGSAIRDIGLLGVSITGGNFVGALGGGNQGSTTITRAYASGDVRGEIMVGGLVGFNAGDISQAYASVNVTASRSDGGGLVGRNEGSLTHSYATGAVSGGSQIGGLVGAHRWGTIDHAYATGAVSGTSAVGGLVGYRFPVGTTLTNAFYATTSAGGSSINNAGGTTGIWTGNGDGIGNTYAELMSPTTFSGWGANLATVGGSAATWRIYAGNTTPLLRSFLRSISVTADLSAASKTYDGTIASGTASYTTNVAGTLLGALNYASSSANAGSYASADGTLRLDGLYTGPQGFDISYAPVSLSITPVVLLPPVSPSIPSIAGTLTGTVRKTYDGTNSATLDAGNFLLSGWVSSDGASVTKTSGRYDNANAGSGKIVTVDLTRGDYQATGTTNLGNYILPTQISAAVGTVDRAALIVRATDASKTYDGQAWRGGNGVGYSGFVNGETASALTGTLGYGGTSQGAVDAGNYLLTPKGLNSTNYAISYRDGTLTVASRAGGGNAGGGGAGGGNAGGGNTGGGNAGGGNPGGGSTGGGNPGGGNAGNDQPFVAAAPAPSGGSLWRALNRATSPFVLPPQDSEPQRKASATYLTVAPGFIRLGGED